MKRKPGEIRRKDIEKRQLRNILGQGNREMIRIIIMDNNRMN